MLCGANGPGRGLTDEPCFVAGAQGIARIERQAFADMMKGAQYTLHDFTLNSPQVQMLGTDVAIIAYTVHEDLTVEGKPVVVDAADATLPGPPPEGISGAQPAIENATAILEFRRDQIR